MKQTEELLLSEKLRPLCPRDDHRMRYEGKGISWKAGTDNQRHTLASYHCNFEGCSVRYGLQDGYFTVVETPNIPFYVEEPAANTLQCPRHGTWLYRTEADENASAYDWRCGVGGCDYVQSDA